MPIELWYEQLNYKYLRFLFQHFMFYVFLCIKCLKKTEVLEIQNSNKKVRHLRLL